MILNQQIFDSLLEEDDDLLIKELESADEYSSKFKISELLVEQACQNVKTESCAGSDGILQVEKRKFKLPTLEFKKFGGEIKDWLPFWGQFKKIHEDPDIDSDDKYQYLIQATFPN